MFMLFQAFLFSFSFFGFKVVEMFTFYPVGVSLHFSREQINAGSE